MNKKILITGSTGTIGEAIAKELLTEGWEIHSPVRNIEKAQELFLGLPNIYLEKRDLEDFKSMEEYAQTLLQKGFVPAVALFLAGDLKKDSTFPGTTDEERHKHSLTYHRRVNTLTAHTTMEGLKKAFGASLRETIGFVPSSWAVEFAADDPKRAISAGYIVSKIEEEEIAHAYEPLFKKMVIDRPGLIDSTITRREFPELIADPSVPKLTAERYVPIVRKLLGI